MFYSDNPLADFDKYDRWQQEQLEKRPKCYGCGDPIQGSRCYCHKGHKYHLTCWELAASDIMPEYIEVTVDD